MFRTFTVIVLLIIMCTCKLASAQLVNYNFDNLELAENFGISNSNWTIVSNSDNLFLVQNGEYLLNRKSIVSPFAIISGIPLTYASFKLVTSLNLQKSIDNKGSIGLLFALQADKRGGYLLEVNSLLQFRIRKLAGSDYIYISGNEKNGGWEKNEAVLSPGTANIIEIRFGDQNYDLYINNKIVKSIANKNYATGSFGFVIGPGSKGSIDFVHIYTRSDEPELIKANVDDNETALAQSIITLQTEVNSLKEENEMLRKTIAGVKSETKTVDSEKQKLKEELAQQQSDYNNLKNTNDSLLIINGELRKYKELIAANGNGDLVINLSKSLKAEKEKNNALIQSNKKLQDQLNLLNQENKTNTPQNMQQHKSEDFNLPK